MSDILLLGLPKSLLQGLHVAQNTEACFVSRIHWAERHNTCTLHWLPVAHKLGDKCLTMVLKGLQYKCFSVSTTVTILSYTPKLTTIGQSGSETSDHQNQEEHYRCRIYTIIYGRADLFYTTSPSTLGPVKALESRNIHITFVQHLLLKMDDLC